MLGVSYTAEYLKRIIRCVLNAFGLIYIENVVHSKRIICVLYCIYKICREGVCRNKEHYAQEKTDNGRTVLLLASLEILVCKHA